MTLGALQEHARAAGFDVGMDFAARDSATLGGIASTEAGGLVAFRHGTARARIAGLEAVLGDGSVVRRMSGLLKDNAGYALPALLVGSEGTLGVITRVRWKLVAPSSERVAALVSLDSIEAAAGLLGVLRKVLPDDALVADDTASRRRMWRLRESHTEAIARRAWRTRWTSACR